MKAHAMNPVGQQAITSACSASRLTHLHLVSSPEVERLRKEVAMGRVPLDLEMKLDHLAKGELGQRFIAQNCRTILALLQATQDGTFTEASRTDTERLLRVLAYVRKDDDAIPDYRPEGFLDDQQEVRAVTTELHPLLRSFKAWRLQHQVPALWLAYAPRVNRAAQSESTEYLAVARG